MCRCGLWMLDIIVVVLEHTTSLPCPHTFFTSSSLHILKFFRNFFTVLSVAIEIQFLLCNECISLVYQARPFSRLLERGVVRVQCEKGLAQVIAEVKVQMQCKDVAGSKYFALEF